jgi:hypothetical protein
MFLGEFVGNEYLHDGLPWVKEKGRIEQGGGDWQARRRFDYKCAMGGGKFRKVTLAMVVGNQ